MICMKIKIPFQVVGLTVLIHFKISLHSFVERGSHYRALAWLWTNDPVSASHLLKMSTNVIMRKVLMFSEELIRKELKSLSWGSKECLKGSIICLRRTDDALGSFPSHLCDTVKHFMFHSMKLFINQDFKGRKLKNRGTNNFPRVTWLVELCFGPLDQCDLSQEHNSDTKLASRSP